MVVGGRPESRTASDMIRISVVEGGDLEPWDVGECALEYTMST